MVLLRYDGKFTNYPGSLDTRSWTLMTHFTDKRGMDRFHGSFCIQGLIELGIIGGH